MEEKRNTQQQDARESSAPKDKQPDIETVTPDTENVVPDTENQKKQNEEDLKDQNA
jgi:hypothetical protein